LIGWKSKTASELLEAQTLQLERQDKLLKDAQIKG
jgi:hypothetical protein